MVETLKIKFCKVNKMVETNDKYSMLDFRLTGKNIKIDFSKHLTKKKSNFCVI